MISKIITALVLLGVMGVAVAYSLGEYGIALPFIFPLGGAPK